MLNLNFRKLDERAKFLETFSVEKWKELAFEKKKEHTFVECSSCQKNFGAIQSTYPVEAQSRIFKQIKEATPFGIAEKVVTNISESGTALSKATANKTAAKCQKQRLLSSFETPEETKERTRKKNKMRKMEL